jgi:hypothetical protein
MALEREDRTCKAHDAGRTTDSCVAPLRFLPRIEPLVFPEALSQIITRLDQARENRLLHAYALVGGFAVSAWGVARATQDIDLAVALGTSEPKALATYLGAVYEAGDADDPLRGVFRLILRSEGQDVPVQLIVLRPKWVDEVFRDVEPVNVLGCAIPVVNWKPLVLMKLYAGGPVDIQDAKSILAVRKPNSADRKSLIARADVLGLAQEVQALLDLLS